MGFRFDVMDMIMRSRGERDELGRRYRSALPDLDRAVRALRGAAGRGAMSRTAGPDAPAS